MTTPESNPEGKKPKKKFMWLGYSGYGGVGQANPNIEVPSSVKNPNLVKKLLQIFGILKASPEDEPEEHTD